MTMHEYNGNELEIFKCATNWKNYWATKISPYIHGRTLEVGAGIGSSTIALKNTKHLKWTCLEPDQNLAKKLTQMFEQKGWQKDYEVSVKTLNEIPEHERFETILYLDVLEHIEEDEYELQKAVKHLEKDGHLIILAPAHQFLFSEFDKQIGHFRRYTRESLISIAPLDISLVTAIYLDSAGLLASLSNRLFLHSASPKQSQINFWDKFLIPCSRITDILFFHKLGKSVLVIWRKR